MSGLKEAMIEHGRISTKPLMLSSTLGNHWVAVFDPDNDGIHQYHILGPVFTDHISNQLLQRRVDRYEKLPLLWKQTFIRLVEEFPVVPRTTLLEYAIMLHYTVTGEQISISDFVYKTVPEETEPLSDTIEKEERKSQSWMVEQELLNNVREGNLNYQSTLAHASTVSSGVKINVGNPVRRAKDSGIVFVALCTRAAIDGGLSAQTAYTLQDKYTQSIETTESISEVANINHQMYEDFIQRIHKISQSSNTSAQIRSCTEQIEMHITEPISIAALAKSVGYTDYYLSRKFKNETGLSINEYIKQQRLQKAKHWLANSALSVQEISERLQFCSRSYFGEMFRKEMGISPTEYREKHQKV